MRLFVPGRICLFGEHSDWAGGYRRINSSLEKGYTIITGTNQGIYADVSPHPNKLIIKSVLNNGKRKEPFEIEMKPNLLLEEAEKGGFFSYAAGVAYQVLTHYRVNGLIIDNYMTDLPIKKGLSSSAAMCVLIARAFNRIYDLKMTVRGEMEYAYLGEITTPSRCGRMDQGCAYGNKPVLMVFNGDRIDVQELKVNTDLYYVIVDLNSKKDTKKILGSLNSCFPFAENEMQEKVQQYLGPINADIVKESAEALQQGDSALLGDLMTRAQTDFDKHLSVVCPSELTAPVLHELLSYEPIQKYICGGKGVGSQGDGSAQILAKDEESQKIIREMIKKDLKMDCYDLTIKSFQKVRKAVIPAAGFGTRLFPATKAIKKELFPIIDSDGRIKPVIQVIVEEAISAGIEDIGIIVQEKDVELFEEYFKMPPHINTVHKLSKSDQKYVETLSTIGSHISFIIQDEQEGFGHAVLAAKEWVDDEPFLLLLGDHLYRSSEEVSCAGQIVEQYNNYNQSIVGITETPIEEIGLFGCVSGEWDKINSTLIISEIVEKPTQEYAREHLTTENLGEDRFYSLFGQYVIKPSIFAIIEESISLNLREHGEFQLTNCLHKLQKEEGMIGYVVKGKRFDIGSPSLYKEAIMHYNKD